MLRLFDCAVSAARAQLLIALVAMVLVVSVKAGGDAASGLPERVLRDPALLKWILLGTAALCATSSSRSLARTAARVDRETHRITGGRAKRLQIRLLMNLRLATGAMAVLTLTPAPDLLVRTAAQFFDPGLAQSIWAGTMSIGLAYFGSCARAARVALRSPAANLSSA